MARVKPETKTCPDCKAVEPVLIEFVPDSTTLFSPHFTWRLTCENCGHVYAPDGPELRPTEVGSWMQKQRAEYDGHIFPGRIA